MSEKTSILQISPGAGFWVAIEEGGVFTFQPVVCFALVRNEGGEDGPYEEIIPMAADDIASGLYEPSLLDMAGLVHESDFSELGVSLKPGRKPRKSGDA
jgi:hypothetical protein